MERKRVRRALLMPKWSRLLENEAVFSPEFPVSFFLPRFALSSLQQTNKYTKYTF